MLNVSRAPERLDIESIIDSTSSLERDAVTSEKRRPPGRSHGQRGEELMSPTTLGDLASFGKSERCPIHRCLFFEVTETNPAPSRRGEGTDESETSEVGCDSEWIRWKGLG